VLLTPLTTACLVVAAHAYQLPPIDLYAILIKEGGHVGQSSHNRNGTDDLGPFQINTVWGSQIAKYWHVSVPRGLERVRDNGCAGAMIASAILKKYLLETRGDLPKAIGFYHSHTEALAASYRDSVLASAAKFIKDARKPRTAQR
jgi:hypothetical protein